MVADGARRGWVDEFVIQRSRLFGLAYRLLGEATEAEDVIQDAYLRWAGAAHAEIHNPEAWLTRVVTNLCLNVLASARRRRENYVGTWLPEPVLTGGGPLGPLETVEQRESVSLSVLALLERLNPQERAVFVLREAFRHSHREVGELLDIDEAHSRQLHRRARGHVADARPRFVADREHQRRFVERFLAAMMHGDTVELEQLLADDVVSWADGGGATAARRPIVGRGKVVRYLYGLSARSEAGLVTTELVEINGEPGVIFGRGGARSFVEVVEP